MRIVLLTSCVYGDPTLVSIMEGLAKAYRAAGHAPTIVGVRPPKFVSQDRVSVKPWGNISLVGAGTYSRLDAVRVFVEVWKLLRDADVVQFCLLGLWTRELGACWLACALRGTPRCFTLLGWLKPANEVGLWRRFAAGSRWVTALSGSIAREMERWMPSLEGRIHVVSGGFDPEERSVSPAARPRDYVLSVARLAPYKGTDILLMAWKDVCDRVPEVDLVLCGPDRSEGRYQRLARSLGISSRVVFTDRVDRAGVWSLLRPSLAVVLASRLEAFGVAVVEGLAAGKAVLATRSGGPEEIIEDGVTGLLVPPKDVAALRDGLLRLLEDAELRRRLGTQGLRAAERYHWSANARSYLGLWNAPIIEQPKPYEHSAAVLECS